MLPDEPPDELRRLDPGWYRGTAWVHWTMAIDDRRSCWLNQSHHSAIRELLIHTCSRYLLLCPAYCLMPDHAHFLWMGLSPTSDQRNAAKFFRKAWNRLLEPSACRLQKQAHDHVLDETERNPAAFEDVVRYILRNPERARLVDDWKEWPYLGSIAVGYPDFNPEMPFGDHCERLWKIHHREKGKFDGM